MQTINHTPFTVGTMIWSDQQGRARLTIIVKAAFTLGGEGPPAPAAEPWPILTADVPYGDEPMAPVKFESDLVPFKPRSDVMLVGKAHAPGGRRVPQLDVTVRVGPVKKTVRVFGYRRWWYPSKLALVPDMLPPEPFETMELSFDRAYGGIDEAAALCFPYNLGGRGFIGKKSKASIDGKLLPNLEDPANLIRAWDTMPRPAGFGFWGRGSLPRLRYLGTYDEKYQTTRAPLPPEDFSPDFYNAAHPDLQVNGYLRGDEPVELLNVSRTPELRFNLPGVRPKITLHRWAQPPDEWLERNITAERELSLDDVPTSAEPLTPNLDTLVFVPEEGVFYEVFRAVASLPDLDTLDVARIEIGL